MLALVKYARVVHMEREVISLIENALGALGYESAPVQVSFPKELAHGDYMTNVALVLGKNRGEQPSLVAEKIRDEIVKTKPEWLLRVEVAGPGFINFTLSNQCIGEKVGEIASSGDSFGKSEIHKGKKILVEHSSPNLFKPFHIGHFMNNAIGESIARLAKVSGAGVEVISYPSDISLGVAKAIFIILEKYGHDFEPKDIALLGEAYVEGTKRYDEDESTHVRIKEIASNLYGNVASPELDVFNACKTFNIDYFKHVTNELGSHFDDFIYESEAGLAGEKIVRAHPEVFEASEGAIIYAGEKDGLHTRVFINKEGHPTYEAKDLGLLSLKFSRYSPDVSIFITDNEQKNYFEVVSTAAGKIEKTWQEKTIHRTHGRMSFKGQKMSSRLGGVPLAEATLQEVASEVKEKNPELTDRDAKLLALSSLKFSILRAKAGSNIDFDPETSISFLGATGPYLQYAAVRASSLLAKAPSAEGKMPEGWQTTDLEREIVRFPSIVERAIEEWEPHHVAGYALGLAQSFNSWYAASQIIDDTPESPYKIAITRAFLSVLKNALHLLAIEVPEKM